MASLSGTLFGIAAEYTHFACASLYGMGVQDEPGAPGVSQERIDEIVGEGARDRGGKGNANAGDGGVAFVLSSSGPSPGGPDRVCKLSCHQPCSTHSCTTAFLFPPPLKQVWQVFQLCMRT